MNKVAIQGIEGSYHHQVAMEYFGDSVEVIELLSFDEVADSSSELGRSIGLVIEEFQAKLPLIDISSLTGEGFEAVFRFLCTS